MKVSSLDKAAFLPPFVRTVAISCRPWSFPASLCPVAVAIALAVRTGMSVNIAACALTLTGVTCLHAAGNLLNTLLDYQRGNDAADLPGCDDVTLVDGHLSESAVDRFALLMILGGLACLVGLVAVSPASPVVLCAFAGLGAALAAAYTTVFKPLALGDIAIFMAFGPLLMGGVQAAVAGQVKLFAPTAVGDWLHVDCAVPVVMGMLAMAVLHANNVRDVQSDARVGGKTVANVLSATGRVLYFAFLVLGSHALLLATAWAQEDVRLAFSSVLGLPWALALVRRIAADVNNPVALRDAPQSVGQHNTLVGCFVLLALFPEELAARCALASLFGMGGINNLLSFSYTARLTQAKLSALLGFSMPLLLSDILLAGASFLQISASGTLALDLLPPRTSALLLGVAFLLPVTLVIHDFWMVNESNDFLRRHCVDPKTQTVRGGAPFGSRQFLAFTSDFDADFVPFVKNLQVGMALYFYVKYRESEGEGPDLLPIDQESHFGVN